jgi:hypothetical protein
VKLHSVDDIMEIFVIEIQNNYKLKARNLASPYGYWNQKEGIL